MMEEEVIISGRKIKLTNLNKIYWPDEKITKAELVHYYAEVAEYILPFLKDRPQSLHRFPDGIAGESFYQKDVGGMPPDWVKTVKIYSESHDKEINYLVCNDKATLIYMVNLGCIEINPWNSSLNSLGKPDYVVLDLDPEDIPFEAVAETALAAHAILEKYRIPHYLKTSGATGLHVYIPLRARYDYETGKNFAKMLAILINAAKPKITSLERSPAARQKKVYLDYLQNSLGQTLAACYSVRPEKAATISLPLSWTQLEKGANPADFNIKNGLDLIKKSQADFSRILTESFEIEAVLKKIEA